MTTQRQQRIARPALRALALVAVATLALTGCGGGGDDSTDEDGDGTGLVPDAPALGATLFSDATVLRPMKAGARWNFAGTAADGGAYANVITQTSAPVGVTESSTNLLNLGAHSVHVVVVNGNIVQPDAVDVDGDGVLDLANMLELRSPVRVNDQYVAVDHQVPKALPDLDGDGIGEALDVAVYSRVIGTEDVVLDGLPVQRAVRIDRTGVTRVVMSKDGSKLPSITAITTTWYAPSVGIVRRRFDRPTDVGAGREITDERATGWAGLP